MDYAIRNIREVEDSALRHGLSETQESRFPARELGVQSVGFSHQVIKPDKRQSFAHRHRQGEEVYVVLSGRGRVKLDDDVREVRALDAIRIGPRVVRMFEAGPEGLELLIFGPRFERDTEMVEDFWTD